MTAASGLDNLYFFLSYAHSDPLAGYPDANPDKLVAEFFGDLADAVRRASPRRSFAPGFYDQEIPVAADWKVSLTRALSTAQVFVPLYSPGYLAKSLPGREWESFRTRMEDMGLPDPQQRFAPVLWTPLGEAQGPVAGLEEALALGADHPAYAENGLRMLLKIGWYRDSYEAVVRRLAERIVMLAEFSPIQPHEVQDIDEMTSPFSPDSRLAVFAIETAAPTRSTVAAGHDPSGYGEDSTDWRPFPNQELPLAEYARQVAERLDFKADVSGLKAASEKPVRRPGIIVIDPWFVADEDGQVTLEAAVAGLPRWVLPLLVVDDPDDPRTRKFAGQVRDILAAAGALSTDSSRRAVEGVNSLSEFVSTVRSLVAEAEKQYLRYRSGRHPGGQVTSPSSNRPSLRRPVRPDEPVSSSPEPGSAPDSLGETPHA
ncbi:MAG TPA: TIR-like protein FxsC [Trebonia sp.]|jgi:FxsC-like protein|nr:TIR-like protein FxsC [Trebonia sp.]